MAYYVVREYDVLARGVEKQSAEAVGIPEEAWDWLAAETCGGGRHKRLVQLCSRRGEPHLQLLNYVGVVVTPCSTEIEILPKTASRQPGGEEQAGSRRLLIKMLNRVYKLNMRQFELSHLHLFHQTLPEILLGHFLSDVKSLTSRGLRQDYVTNESNEPYLRGRLKVANQMRQPPGKKHRFEIEQDLFVPDRPENRLLHSALQKVNRLVRSLENRRLARELLFAFEDVPFSNNYGADLGRWQKDRTMVHYQSSRVWCGFILYDQSPLAIAGKHFGQSFLFSMHDLFERYVAAVLSSEVFGNYKLHQQKQSQHLIDSHRDQKLFLLKPDITIEKAGNTLLVADCKWKRINQENHDNNDNERNTKYGISQGDLYQLFAYGQKYLGGQGHLLLIYPVHRHFNRILPPFDFDSNLSLYAVPFDLENDCLTHEGQAVRLNNFITGISSYTSLIEQTPSSGLTEDRLI